MGPLWTQGYIPLWSIRMEPLPHIIIVPGSCPWLLIWAKVQNNKTPLHHQGPLITGKVKPWKPVSHTHMQQNLWSETDQAESSPQEHMGPLQHPKLIFVQFLLECHKWQGTHYHLWTLAQCILTIYYTCPPIYPANTSKPASPRLNSWWCPQQTCSSSPSFYVSWLSKLIHKLETWKLFMTSHSSQSLSPAVLPSFFLSSHSLHPYPCCLNITPLYYCISFLSLCLLTTKPKPN